MTAQWLNTIGLALGMVGVVVIFIWGPPQPDLDEHIKIVLSNKTDEATKRLKRRHEIMSRVGLGLIGLGFFVQFVAVWS